MTLTHFFYDRTHSFQACPSTLGFLNENHQKESTNKTIESVLIITIEFAMWFLLVSKQLRFLLQSEWLNVFFVLFVSFLTSHFQGNHGGNCRTVCTHFVPRLPHLKWDVMYWLNPATISSRFFWSVIRVSGRAVFFFVLLFVLQHLLFTIALFWRCLGSSTGWLVDWLAHLHDWRWLCLQTKFTFSLFFERGC